MIKYSNIDLINILNKILNNKVIIWECMRYLNGIVSCRFGFWESNDPNYIYTELPSINNTNLNIQSISRANELINSNVLWSGGIDSTYVVAAFIKANIPFKILCDKTSITRGNYFYNWLINNGFKDYIIYNDSWYNFKYDNMISGDLADILFYPARRGSTLSVNYKYSDTLFKQILEFSEYIGKPAHSSFDIRRIFKFSINYDSTLMESRYYIKTEVKPFFDTKEFSDISYTQYWDNKDREKIYFKKFISDVTNDSKMMTEVKVTKDLHLFKL